MSFNNSPNALLATLFFCLPLQEFQHGTYLFEPLFATKVQGRFVVR